MCGNTWKQTGAGLQRVKTPKSEEDCGRERNNWTVSRSNGLLTGAMSSVRCSSYLRHLHGINAATLAIVQYGFSGLEDKDGSGSTVSSLRSTLYKQ